MMPHFAVDDERGRRWKLFLAEVDAGSTYWLDGESYPEDHPKAVHYLRHLLRELEGARRPCLTMNVCLPNGNNLRWLLERNGNDPDGSLPPGPPSRFTGSPKRPPSGSPRGSQRFKPETAERLRRMNS